MGVIPDDDFDANAYAQSLLGSVSAPKKPKGSDGWWTPDRVDQAVNHLQTHANLSPIGAKGLVARWKGVEAGGGPNSLNPNSGAIGIGQWLGARKRGVPSDFEGQLNHAVKELNTTEGAAARRLRNAQTDEDAAIGASMFERAEGYNPRTGRDNFVIPTMRTLKGMGATAPSFDANAYAQSLLGQVASEDIAAPPVDDTFDADQYAQSLLPSIAPDQVSQISTPDAAMTGADTSQASNSDTPSQSAPVPGYAEEVIPPDAQPYDVAPTARTGAPLEDSAISNFAGYAKGAAKRPTIVKQRPQAQPVGQTPTTSVREIGDEILTDEQGNPLPDQPFVQKLSQVDAKNAYNAVSDVITPPQGATEQEATDYIKKQLEAKYGGNFSNQKFLSGYSGEPVQIRYKDLMDAGVDINPLISQKVAENRVENPEPDLRVGGNFAKMNATDITDAANAVGNPLGDATAQALGIDPRKLTNLFGDVASGAIGTALNSGGNTSRALAGLLRVIGDLSPTKGDSMAEAAKLKPYRAGEDVVKYLQGIADDAGVLASNTGTKYTDVANEDDKGYLEGRPIERDSVGSKVGKAIGGLADIPRIALYPGGPIVQFAADSALMAAGEGDQLDWDKVQKAGKKGGALGAITLATGGAGKLLEPQIGKALTKGIELGAIGPATYAVSRAMGDSKTEAFDNAVMFTAFHAWGVAKEAVTNRPIRVKAENGEAVINIDDNGKVTTLDPKTEAKATIVIPDVEEVNRKAEKEGLVEKPTKPLGKEFDSKTPDLAASADRPAELPKKVDKAELERKIIESGAEVEAKDTPDNYREEMDKFTADLDAKTAQQKVDHDARVAEQLAKRDERYAPVDDVTLLANRDKIKKLEDESTMLEGKLMRERDENKQQIWKARQNAVHDQIRELSGGKSIPTIFPKDAAESPSPKPKSEPQEPWQMTKDEYIQKGGKEGEWIDAFLDKLNGKWKDIPRSVLEKEAPEYVKQLDKPIVQDIAERDAEPKIDLGTFGEGKSPLQRGQLEKVLGKQYRYKGKVVTRQQYINQIIAEGGKVVGEPKQKVVDGKIVNYESDDPVLQTVDGRHLPTTKTELDYAQHLINEQQSAPKYLSQIDKTFEQKQTEKFFNVKRAARDIAYQFAGADRADTRQSLIKELTGEDVPKAKSGIHEVERALNQYFESKNVPETDFANIPQVVETKGKSHTSEQPAESAAKDSGETPEPYSPDALKRAFNLTDEQTAATHALVKSMGLDTSKIEVAKGGTPDESALRQAAWHGSPHKFDKFDSSRIGTGEGAQAYGHGLYFTDKESVADFYKQSLTQPTVNGEKLHSWLYDNHAEQFDDRVFEDVRSEMQRGETLTGAVQEVIDQLESKLESETYDEDTGAYDSPSAFDAIRQIKLLKKFAKADVNFPEGAKYKVNLQPQENEYLLWDKPLSEQSSEAATRLKDGLESEIQDETESADIAEQILDKSDATGGDIYTILTKHFGSKPVASEFLKSLGIRGIKYLDGSSRGKGEGSHNYVIFDDKDVEITDIFNQGPKGSAEIIDNGKAIIRGLENPDVSTATHEIAHVARRQLLNRDIPEANRADITDADIDTVEQWAGVKDGKWHTTGEEKFARGFERYLRDGKAPTEALADVFAKFKDWLTGIYKTLKGGDIDIKISPEMRKVFDKLVTPESAESRAKSIDSGATTIAPENVLDTAAELVDSHIKDESQDIINSKGEINNERVKDVAGRISKGELAVTRLDPAAEQGRIAGGQRNVEASAVLGASEAKYQEASRRGEQGVENRPSQIRRQENTLERYARENGAWLDPKFTNRQNQVGGGAEAKVYHNDGEDFVTKVVDYRAINRDTTPQEFLDRISLFNTLFPEAPYTLEGVTRVDGKMRFVVKQPYIDGGGVQESVFEDAMKARGFEKTGRETYGNSLYKVFDLHEKNAMQDADGNIFVIDAVPKAKHVEPFEVKQNEQESRPPSSNNIEPLAEKGADTQSREGDKAGEPPASDNVDEPKGKPSKIGKSIEAKAIEKGLADTFGGTAEYDPTSVKRQAELAADILTDPERVKRIIAGDEKLPTEMRSSYFIKAAEDAAQAAGDVQTLMDLAKSKLTSETSTHAQEMRMMGEREPDSALARIQELQKARRDVLKSKGTNEKAVNAQIKDLEARIEEHENSLAEMRTRAETAEAKASQQASKPYLDKAERFVAKLDERADAARERLKKRGAVFTAGLDPLALKDLAEIGASHIAHLGLDFAKWSDAMASEFGDDIKKHLDEIWEKAQGIHSKNENTALKALKTRLENQIQDLESQVASKTRSVVSRGKIELDEEAQGLQTKRDALKTELDELVPKARKSLSVEAKQKMYKRSLERRIEALETQIKTGEKPVRGKLPLTPALEKLKTKRNELKAQLPEVDKTISDAQYNQTRQKTLQKQMVDLQKQIDAKTKTVKEMTARKRDPKTNDLINKRDELKKQYDEIFGKPELSDAQRLKMYKARAEKRLEELKSGVVKQKREPVPLDAKGRQLQLQLELLNKKVGVTDDEAQTILDLANKVKESRVAMDNGGDRMNYGRAVNALNEYVSDLKNAAKKTTWADIKAQPARSILKGVMAAPGVTKSIAASMDASAILRQGWKTLWSHPGIWKENSIRSIKDLVRTFGKAPVMDELNADLLSRPNALNGFYKKAKLDIGSTEEAFPTSLPEKVPFLGRAFKASENAYTIFTHKTRADVFDKYVDLAQKNGTEMNDKNLENIGRLVNALVGRGYLGAASKAGDVTNVLFFSPRAIKGHLDALTQTLTGGASVSEMAKGDNGGTNFVRKQAATNLIKVIAGTAAVLAIAKLLAPDSVELDPRSTDFGKIRRRGTRFDVTGGFGSLLTLAAREVSGVSKSSTTGKLKSLSEPEYGGDDRLDVMETYFENKLSPIAGMGRDFYKGKDFNGNPMHFDDPKSYGRAGLGLITPLPVKNAVELGTDPNSANMLAGMLADALGISVNTYNSVASIKRDIDIAEKRGDAEEVKRLKGILPQIEAKEKKQKDEQKTRLQATRKSLQ